jgi:CRP-like cAMP-binding protein
MTTQEALGALRAMWFFSGLSDADLEKLASHLIERRFPRNTTIFEEGLPGDYMYIIREGRVKVTKLSNDGREKTYANLDAPEFFGEQALLDGEPRSASVKSLTAVRLLALSRTDFLSLLRSSPDMAMAVIQVLSRRLRDADAQASALSFQRVKERTKGQLMRLAHDPHPGSDRLATQPLTHQQIADMIGTSRETVTRVVKELKEEGWLEQEGKRYLVSPED